jgi:hypothetical protein
VSYFPFMSIKKVVPYFCVLREGYYVIIWLIVRICVFIKDWKLIHSELFILKRKSMENWGDSNLYSMHLLVSMSSLCCTFYVNPSINFNFLSNSYSYYVTIWSVCYFHWMASQNRWLHNRSSSCILVTSCILQLTPNAWQTILISHQHHKIHFFLNLF